MSFIRSKNFRRGKHGALRTLRFLFLASMAVLLSAVEVRGGTLEVRISDHREAIADFEHLYLDIESIRISRGAALKFWQIGWLVLQPTRPTIDLTRYTEEKSVTVFKGAVAASPYDAIDLRLKEPRGRLKSGGAPPIKNLVGPIQLGFPVTAEDETLIVLDLGVLDLSDHPGRGYELIIKGYELYKNGRLLDKIPPG